MTQKLEVVVVRDPDGATHIEAYLGGKPIEADEYLIDAGSGWTWSDWQVARDQNLTAASAKARKALLEHYSDPPGGEYVEDRDGAPWITR